jgi:ribosomal protein S1
VRVLAVDPTNKKLKLTAKPILLSSDSNIILSFDDVTKGNYYYGFITSVLSHGYMVSFFNNIAGILQFKEIEEAGLDKNSFVLGQTVKVYVTYCNKETKRIGLSLQSKGGEVKDNTQSEAVANSLKKINLNNQQPVLDTIFIGDTYEYKVDKKSEHNCEDFLILIGGPKEKKHHAIVLKEHLYIY